MIDVSHLWNVIHGNEQLKSRLISDIMASRLSHAYVIEGPKHSGKLMLARTIASAMCDSIQDVKKISVGASPDVIEIDLPEKKKSIGVDKVREMKLAAYIKPNDLDFKCFIIRHADTLTVQAQNAFLLTLEEPPAYVLFFLLCESAAQLLETIRSRAPTLHTEPIDIHVMDQYLTKNLPEARELKSVNPSEFAEILTTADGKLGIAIELLNPTARKPIMERRETAKKFVRLCSERKNAATTLRYISSLGQKRDLLTDQLSTILLCLRDLLICKQTEEPPLGFFASTEEAHNLAYQFTTPELLSLCNAINEAIDRLLMNANVRLTMTSLAVNTGLLQI